MKKYKIADFVIEYHGDPVYLDERFEDFTCDDSENTDMKLKIVEKKPFFPRFLWNKGKKISIFHFYDDGDVIYQYFPYQKHVGVKLVEMRENFHDVTYYLCDRLDGSYEKMFGHEKYIEKMQGVIFNLFQETFFNMVLFENAMSVHSASVLYNDKAVVFSASSGTGKSTQANMWHKYLGCEVLDGDVTVCREIDGKLFVYGLPWCGSSNQYVNKKAELGALVFLKQAKENSVRKPDLKEMIGYVYSSTFSETLTEIMAHKRADMTTKIIEKALILEYSCNMDPEAVTYLCNFINK